MWHHLSKVPALAARAIIGLAGVVAFGLVAVSAAHAEIKLGFQAPLTGFAAADGKSAKIAAEMAVEQINAAGGEIGQKLQLISYDDQAKSDQAIFTANKLIGEDGVKLVVNASYSASGRAAAPVFQNAGVVMISAYGVHPDITRAGDLMFRLVHLGPPQGRATALFIGKDLKLKKISAITMDNDYGQATMAGFLEAAPKYGTPVIGSQAFNSQKFIDIAGPASEGTYIVDSFDRGRDDAALQRFFAEFTKRAGYPPENVAAITYSAVMLMADAIKRAGSADPPKVRDALAATKNFPLLTGELIGFNKLHEVIEPISVNVIKDAKMKFFAKLGDLEAFAPPEK